MEGYLTLFGSAFLAATLVPFQSELLLVGLLAAGGDALGLWAAASLGNTAGAVVNWVLGRWLLHFQDRRWFPVKSTELARAQGWFAHYGVWILLFTWLPAVGDALTLVAGVMRVRFWLFLLLTATGKALRYAVLIGLAGAAGF